MSFFNTFICCLRGSLGGILSALAIDLGSFMSIMAISCAAVDYNKYNHLGVSRKDAKAAQRKYYCAFAVLSGFA